MRLFTGIGLDPGVVAKLDGLLDRLRPTAPLPSPRGSLRWSRAENLHITTQFIGEWPEERLGELVAALRGVRGEGAIRIAVRGLGWFPNPHSPRVLWAGVEAPPALGELARATGEALAGIGVKIEDRPFRPHLTLARIKDPGQAAPVRRAIAALESTDFGESAADRFFLYLSRRGAGGSVYTKLEEYRIG